MFRRMSRWEMSPEVMEKWLDQLPELMKAFDEIEEEVIIEAMWVTKDRTNWFFVRALQNEDSNERLVSQLVNSEWGKKYAHLMEEQTHHSYEIESVFPQVHRSG